MCAAPGAGAGSRGETGRESEESRENKKEEEGIETEVKLKDGIARSESGIESRSEGTSGGIEMRDRYCSFWWVWGIAQRQVSASPSIRENPSSGVYDEACVL